MRDGFHWRDGLYFLRREDGTVEVTQTVGRRSDDVKWQVEIPPEEWAGIVAAVTPDGADSNSYRRALALHNARRAV